MELSDWLQIHPDCRPAPFGMGGMPTDSVSTPSSDQERPVMSVCACDTWSEKSSRNVNQPAKQLAHMPVLWGKKSKNSPQLWYRLTLQRMREKQQGKF